MKAAQPMRHLDYAPATGAEKAFQKNGRTANKRSSLVFLLALALLAAWFASSALLRLTDATQLAIIIPTMLILLLVIFLIQKSQVRNSEALQSKMDQLIRAAEAVHHSILDLEKLSKAEPFHSGTNFADWSPQMREETNGGSPNGARHNGHNTRHHSGTAHPIHHGAGAHRIKPTAKA